MDSAKLEELERLAKAATPWPWKVVVSDKYTFTVAILPPDFPQTPLVGRIRDEQDAAYIVAACNVVPELIARARELERQRDFLLMHDKTPACLLCDDCSYLVGEPCNWGCTAKLKIRKKCLEKAVERAERATGKTADVDAEQDAKEAGE